MLRQCPRHSGMLTTMVFILMQATALNTRVPDPTFQANPWGWTVVHTYVTVVFVSICLLLGALAFLQARGYIRTCWNKSDSTDQGYVEMGGQPKKALPSHRVV
ncbi:hypothetical protein H310_05986 [Aphanomyces invadans]|uniref:Uncharacterized protein n=1 Tax=Aphanomyces invadans TaxID=157072 RepID=A0A024U8F8_9STRA|nr:hypothetical protein H310_05986 [Aphanomyces invadans]ETW02485.1 hypothetical protein H310_05986 [Aphanomyces invadans]|eukprot:XP_008869090.1 hypothetical protein H310_05986 [Aphanomyces invadans]